MLAQGGESLKFKAPFKAAKVGKTGLTVNVTVYGPNETVIATGVATEGAKGTYYFPLAGTYTTAAGDYTAVFETTDTTVDSQVEYSLHIVGRPWVQRVDQLVSTPVVVADKTGFALSATGLNLVAGIKGWSLPRTLRALAQFVIGVRSGVPAAGSGGSITFTDQATGDMGTVTVDAAGNITTNAMTPPA